MGEVRFGSSPDFSKDRTIGSRLKEQFEKRFTFTAAKKEWLEKHKARVENLQRVENQLSSEDRKKVVDKLNRDANIGAALTVGKNVLGIMTLIGAVSMGGRMVMDETFRGKVVDKARSFDLKGTLGGASDRTKAFFERVRTQGWQSFVRTKGSGIE